MRVLRYPFAAFATSFGSVAVLLEDPSITGQGPDLAHAEEDLLEQVRRNHRESPWMGAPQCQDFQIHVLPVTLRPEFRVQKRVLPCDGSLDFRFPCAVGVTESGLRVCVVPSLGLQFYFESDRKLRELVGHYVQEQLKGMTPTQLLSQVPPAEMEIYEGRVKLPRSTSTRAGQDLARLEQVAEPAHSSRLRGIGREELQKQLLEALQSGLSVALVGPPSAGKSTLLVEVARKLHKIRLDRREPRTLWRTSASRLVAGMSYLGQWEERCEGVVSELATAGGILAAENLMELVRQGGSEPGGSIAAFLTPYVLEGSLQMVGEATPSEWQACKRMLPAFSDLFRVLQVPAMSDAETLEVLAWIRTSLTHSRRQEISPEVDGQILSLFRRFSPYQALPGSAARFWRRLGESRPRGTRLDRALVVSAFSQQTGIPEEFLLDEVGLEAEDLERQLSSRVMGQQVAQQAAVRVITAFKSGLQDPQRPLAVLLLCGPTGVGKTELGKTLAHILFGEESRLIRLDMSEYSGPGSAQRLLGSLYDKVPAPWLRQLRQRPFSVVLFDEVEKAHPEMFDLLMRAFDEGVLTGPWGDQTSLRTCVLLLTTNLGADQLRSAGFRTRQQANYSQAAGQYFRPELINRLDAIVPFAPLEWEVILAVAQREVGLLQSRPGMRRRHLTLSASGAALEELARRGYDPMLGARPLQRCIEKELIPPLGRYLRARPGLRDQSVQVDYNLNEGFFFS